MSGKQEETSGIAQLGCAEHSCHIYRTAAEQIDALVPWLRSGIEQSERCIYIADASNIAVLREILGTHGVVVDSALEAGVSLLDEDSHPFIRRMRFDMDALFTYLDNLCVEAGLRGRAPIRLARA